MFNAGICNLATESETKDHKAEICVDTRGTAVWTDRQQSRQDSLETRAHVFLCVFSKDSLISLLFGGILTCNHLSCVQREHQGLKVLQDGSCTAHKSSSICHHQIISKNPAG